MPRHDEVVIQLIKYNTAILLGNRNSALLLLKW